MKAGEGMVASEIKVLILFVNFIKVSGQCAEIGLLEGFHVMAHWGV